MQKKNKILYATLSFVILIYFISSFMRNSSIRQAITFIGFLNVLTIILFNKFDSKIDRKTVIGTLVIIIIIILNMVSDHYYKFYEYMYSALGFLSFFIIFSSNKKINYKNNKTVDYLFIALSIVIVILSFSKVAYIFEDGRRNGAMALGLTNSNLAGVLVFLVFNVMLNIYFKKKNKFVLILAIYLLYVIWMTRSRTVMAAAAFIIIVSVFKKKKFNKYTILLAVLSSLLFLFFYINLLNFFTINRIQSVEILGKPLFSGREITYFEYINLLDNYFKKIFGSLTIANFNNAHNGALVVYSSLGIFGLITTFYCVAKQTIIHNNRIMSKLDLIKVAIILSLFILSCGEGIIFMGLFPTIALIVIILDVY